MAWQFGLQIHISTYPVLYISNFSPISTKRASLGAMGGITYFPWQNINEAAGSSKSNSYQQTRGVSMTSRCICTAAGTLFVEAYASALWFNWMWPGTATGSRHFIKAWQWGPYRNLPPPHRARSTQPLQRTFEPSVDCFSPWTLRFDQNKGTIKARVSLFLIIAVFEWVENPEI